MADLATWTAGALALFGPPQVLEDWQELAPTFGCDRSASTFYSGYSKELGNDPLRFTPIGKLISTLIEKLAWEDAALRDLAHYYRLVKFGDAGKDCSAYGR